MISKALNDLYINHDEFVLVNNELRKYNEMKEEIKNFAFANKILALGDLEKKCLYEIVLTVVE